MTDNDQPDATQPRQAESKPGTDTPQAGRKARNNTQPGKAQARQAGNSAQPGKAQTRKPRGNVQPNARQARNSAQAGKPGGNAQPNARQARNSAQAGKAQPRQAQARDAQPHKAEAGALASAQAGSRPGADTPQARRKARDNARLRQVAMRHGAAFLAALTLWGAADFWAGGSGMLLAQGLALLNAVGAGIVIAYLTHEWGHFAGARLARAVSPVMKQPTSFFMFTFKHELNSRSQFLAMSAGGPVANWTLTFVLFLLLPLATWSQALLLATVLAIAVSVSVFELPILRRVMYGQDPAETVQQRLQEAGDLPRYTGLAAGAAAWLLAI